MNNKINYIKNRSLLADLSHWGVGCLHVGNYLFYGEMGVVVEVSDRIYIIISYIVVWRAIHGIKNSLSTHLSHSSTRLAQSTTPSSSDSPCSSEDNRFVVGGHAIVDSAKPH